MPGQYGGTATLPPTGPMPDFAEPRGPQTGVVPRASDQADIGQETELDIQQAVRDLVGAGPLPPGMSPRGGGPPTAPQPTQEPAPVAAVRGFLQGAPMEQAPPQAPQQPMGGGMPRRQPLPPGMAGQSGGMYYPPDFIKNLDLEHPQAGQALDQFTRYAESPVGRSHDLARAEQAADEAYGRGMQGAAVLQSFGDEASAGAYRELQAAEKERFQRAQARRQRMQEDYQKEIQRFAVAKDRISQMQIDPERFWASKSTGSKIASAIFVGLGAAGAVAGGGPNYALKILDDQISRDIDAQKFNIANKRAGLADQRSLLGFMMQQYDTAEQAETATKLFAYEQTAAKVKQIGLTTNSLVTRQKAMAFGAKLDAEKGILEKKLALDGANRAAEIERQRMIANAQAAKARAELEAAKARAEHGYFLPEKDHRFVIKVVKHDASGMPYLTRVKVDPVGGETSMPKLKDKAAAMLDMNRRLTRAADILERGGPAIATDPQALDELTQLTEPMALKFQKEITGVAGPEEQLKQIRDSMGKGFAGLGGGWFVDKAKSLRLHQKLANEEAQAIWDSYGAEGEVVMAPDMENGGRRGYYFAPGGVQREQRGGGATLHMTEE